ncbi:MAG: YggS family pyridoxal phosphate-dependent enzyme [Bacteroidetes bacterium]|jgi:pyridoxal phosphate enzyme (YggS family)|nr:YggS family pyridoxal phosphate-dependent enzyme [Bacteroidota bacterium]
MNSVAQHLLEIKKELPAQVKLIAVSKTYPVDVVMLAYEAGQRVFGENKVQEMCEKQEQMPKDVEWHLIGHLQTNKVKYIAPFVSLIHSVDSLKLLQEINKQAQKNNRVIDCLLQIYIAQEETKFGLSPEECVALLESDAYKQLNNIRVVGLMGMASNTEKEEQIRKEFRELKKLKDRYPAFKEMSCGMSSDYKIAIEEGSTMIRVGSSIFGKRNYTV